MDHLRLKRWVAVAIAIFFFVIVVTNMGKWSRFSSHISGGSNMNYRTNYFSTKSYHNYSSNKSLNISKNNKTQTKSTSSESQLKTNKHTNPDMDTLSPNQNINDNKPVQENNKVKRPNIVFIFADDLGFNDVGYHNPDEMYTPTIDKLAKEGVRLENYYVQPICSPTRQQFFSGRSQIHTGLQHRNLFTAQPLGLPLDSLSMADKLKEAGYATDMVGKWHLGFYKEEYLPCKRGFNSFYGYYLGKGDHYTHDWCLGDVCMLDLHNDTIHESQPDFKQSQVYSTHLFTDEAIRIINNRSKGDKPFFLYLSYQAVHNPLQVPIEYEKVMKDKIDRYDEKDSYRKKYIAMTYAMDCGVERVVKSLKENGVWNNTILIFSSDNGAIPRWGGSNLPLRGQKTTFYEGGVRAVAFVNSPLINKPGYINKELIHVTDWFPTFIALANGNLRGTRDVNGFNQWETVSQKHPSPRDEILFNIDPLGPRKTQYFHGHTFDVGRQAALRKGDYKIITGVRKLSGLVLYNVKKDPEELHDLSDLEGMRSKVMDMLDTLQAYNQTAVPCFCPPKQFIRDVKVWGPDIFDLAD